MSSPVIKTESVVLNKKTYTIYTNTITGVRRVLPIPPADIADLFDFSVTPKEDTPRAAVAQLPVRVPPQHQNRSQNWQLLTSEHTSVPVISSTAGNRVPLLDVARQNTPGRWPLEERRDVGGVGGVEGMLSYHKAPEEHMREYCLKKRLMIEQLETNASPSFIKSCIRSGLPRSGPIDYHAQLALAVGDPCVSVHQFEDKCDQLYAKEMTYIRPNPPHCAICRSHNHTTENHVHSEQQSLPLAPRNSYRLSQDHLTKDHTCVSSEKRSSSSTSRSSSRPPHDHPIDNNPRPHKSQRNDSMAARNTNRLSPSGPSQISSKLPGEIRRGNSHLKRGRESDDSDPRLFSHRNVAGADKEGRSFKKIDDRDDHYNDCKGMNSFEERRQEFVHTHKKFGEISPPGDKNQFDTPSRYMDRRTYSRARSSAERTGRYSKDHADSSDDSSTHSYITKRRTPPKRYLPYLSTESRARFKRSRLPRDLDPWEKMERTVRVSLHLTDIFDPDQFRTWVMAHLPFWSHGGGSWTSLFEKMAEFPNVIHFTGQKVWPPTRDEIIEQLKIHKRVMIVMRKLSVIESLADVAIPTAVQNYLNHSIKSGIGVRAIRRRWEAMSKRYTARGTELSTGESMTRLSTMVSLLLPNYVRIDLTKDGRKDLLTFTSFVVKYFVDDPDVECKQDIVKVITGNWTENHKGVIHDLFAYQDRNDYPVATSLLDWMDARSDRAARNICDPNVDTLSPAVRSSIFQKLAGPS